MWLAPQILSVEELETLLAHKAKEIIPSITWKREVLDNVERTRKGHRQSNTRTVSKAMLGNLLRDGMEHLWAFPSTSI